MSENFHQENLRKGRVSIPGQFYSITKCCADRNHFLIPDLKDFAIAQRIFEIIAGSIAWLNEKSYFVCRNYVMMPDHLHLIFQLGEVRALEQVMHSFASFTANQINDVLRRSGSLWQSGYYDHALRDDHAFNRHVRYIAENPVRAGFVPDAQDWPFSMIEFFW
ncbi:MAG: transposase [bacterium]